jgi:hypothetical protein
VYGLFAHMNADMHMYYVVFLAPSLYCNISYQEIKLQLMCFIMECKVYKHHFRLNLMSSDSIVAGNRRECVKSVVDSYNLKDALNADKPGLKNITLWRQ